MALEPVLDSYMSTLHKLSHLKGGTLNKENALTIRLSKVCNTFSYLWADGP